MIRSSLYVSSVVLVALFASVAAAQVGLPVVQYTVTGDPTSYLVTADSTPTGGLPFMAVRFPAGRKVLVGLANGKFVSDGSWDCVNQFHSTIEPQTNNKFNGVICKGDPLVTITFEIEVRGDLEFVDPDAYEFQSGSGDNDSDPVVLVNELAAVTPSDDIPTTIDSGPTMGFWAALCLVLLLLGTMTWFLWPRQGRAETV